MSDELAELKKEVSELKAKVRALKKRLREKRRYERAMLINSGCTPAYLAHIDEKDDAVLSD